MAKISTYPVDSTINGLDILIGSDADDSNITKNYRINNLKSFVLSGLGININLVLSSVSNVDQSPNATDTPLQITFGPAQGTPSDPVQLLSDGSIVFNQGGSYLFNGYANFNRTDNNGTVNLLFRALLNGVQITPTKAAEIEKLDFTVPYELTVPIVVSAGDVLTWEIMCDSVGGGQGDGGVFTFPTVGGWGLVPSTDINIWKVGI